MMLMYAPLREWDAVSEDGHCGFLGLCPFRMNRHQSVVVFRALSPAGLDRRVFSCLAAWRNHFSRKHWIVCVIRADSLTGLLEHTDRVRRHGAVRVKANSVLIRQDWRSLFTPL